MCIQRFASFNLHCSDKIGREPRMPCWHYLANLSYSAIVQLLAVRLSLLNPFTLKNRSLCHLVRPHSSNAYSVVFEYPSVAVPLDVRARGSRPCGRENGIVASSRAASSSCRCFYHPRFELAPYSSLTSFKDPPAKRSTLKQRSTQDLPHPPFTRLEKAHTSLG